MCLDPTLLLEQDEWRRLITPITRPPYYLLYMLKYDELLVQKARAASDKAGLDLAVITGSFIPQFGLSGWSETGVPDWLSLFAGAEGVFTNSFHGTAFSLIFEKPLCVELPGGGLESRNGRIEELLKTAGLTETEKGSSAFLSVDPSREALTEAKAQSMQYLQDIVSHILK